MRAKDPLIALKIEALRDEIAHYCDLGERVIVFDNDQTELLGPLKEGAIRVAARRRPADIVSGPMPIKWERAPHSTFTRTSTASAGRWKT
jgi:hypothetical protein